MSSIVIKNALELYIFNLRDTVVVLSIILFYQIELMATTFNYTRPLEVIRQGRSLLCYSTEAGGLGLSEAPSGVQGQTPISDFEQFRVYLGPVLLQNSHKNMSQLYTIVHS